MTEQQKTAEVREQFNREGNGEKNFEKPKLTAIDIWNRRLQQVLAGTLICNPNRKLKTLPVQMILQRSKLTIEAAFKFEAYKWTLISNLVGKLHNDQTTAIRELEKQYYHTRFFEFVKRKTIEREMEIITAKREAYFEALKVILNTLPPKESTPAGNEPQPVAAK